MKDRIDRRGMPRGMGWLLGLFLLVAFQPARADSIEHFTQHMERHQGYFSFYWDAEKGRIYLEIDQPGTAFIYQAGLATGLGSNDIGLDRLQVGSSKLVRFDRVGNKVFLRHINLRFRADSTHEPEKKAVEGSFSDSILGGFVVVAETSPRVLIDLTDFLLSDQYGIQAALEASDQGSFSVDPSRSSIYLPNTRTFPINTEFEAVLTFTGKRPGAFVRQVAATPEALTLHQHFSFIKLPEEGFTPRPYHLHSGFTPVSYVDYAAGLTESMQQAFIARHRLQKKDPQAAVSEAKEPIVYYLDQGIPEPVRSAILEGAMFWNEAFEAAGYRNAFQVRPMPPDMDPMDARYHVINWAHRATRGYSFGGYVMDPRTGEIIKGSVTIGSLRVRQNMLIANGLMNPFDEDDDQTAQAQALALARQRQLAAHEVGHSLGLAHNSIASTSPFGRASVMDDPYPWVRLDPQGGLDFSEVYALGTGEWDKVSIQYGYADYPEGTDLPTRLAETLEAARQRGLRFFSHHREGAFDRSLVNAHRYSSIWDVGPNTVEALAEMMKVRQYALDHFSEKAIPIGEPLSKLEETLVPIYYFHRYQLEAAVKHIGGMDYEYALRRPDGQQINQIVSKEEQSRALEVILEALHPDQLLVPAHILALIPPKALGNAPSRESFPRKSSLYLGLDPLDIGESLIDHILGLLLEPTRLARIYEFSLRDPGQLALPDYLGRLDQTVFQKTSETGLKGALARRVQHVYLLRLMHLAENPQASLEVRTLVRGHLSRLEQWMRTQPVDTANQDHMAYQLARLSAFFQGTYRPDLGELARMPPGSPI